MTGQPGAPYPRLAPPGAGVPAIQRWAGRYVLLPFWRATLPPRRVPALMERQASRLLDLAEGLPAPLLERRVLVPPQIGLEDSSRFHSWTMVVEHLTIAGDGIAAILSALTHGRAPAGAVRVEDLKPVGGIGAPHAVERYRTMLRRMREVIGDESADWEAGLRHAHPWFGPLGPKAWACFAPFHQAIHLKQARRIRGLLSVEVP